MNEECERRQFERHPAGFAIAVEASDKNGQVFQDRGILEDMSGVGFRFNSRLVDRYFVGQVLDVTIVLPGTDEVRGQMKGRATVVRVGRQKDRAEEGQGPRTIVAVQLDTVLRFERQNTP